MLSPVPLEASAESWSPQAAAPPGAFGTNAQPLIVRLVRRRVPILLAACPLCRLGVAAASSPVTRGSRCWADSWFPPLCTLGPWSSFEAREHWGGEADPSALGEREHATKPGSRHPPANPRPAHYKPEPPPHPTLPPGICAPDFRNQNHVDLTQSAATIDQCPSRLGFLCTKAFTRDTGLGAGRAWSSIL